MKILINTPSLKLMGGVASHYKGLRAFWTENVMYNTIGKRNATKCGSGNIGYLGLFEIYIPVVDISSGCRIS